PDATSRQASRWPAPPTAGWASPTASRAAGPPLARCWSTLARAMGEDRNGDQRRKGLQTLAVALIGIGGLLSLIGIASFFSSMNNPGDGPPSGFFLAFVGFPMVGLGIWIAKFAFIRPVSKYLAGETEPAVEEL